uniref:uncharacterized protein LOC101298389 n=1 Tax=Fragaria vesca subsp. vesca TaxID=101020 RepID=UPI0005CB1C5A|nr:PREDICTED: uncharacterized protein LOC101298389 [Fragaria vesca subsp. vesca]
MADTTSSFASNPVSELNSWNRSVLKANSTDMVSGGINRIKQHIANIKGNVDGCKRSSDEDKTKCIKAIDDGRNKKRQKFLFEEELRQEVVIEEGEMEEDGSSHETRRKKRFLGPIDRYASAIDPDSSLDGSKKMKQQNINDSLFKERTHNVHQYLVRWVYKGSLPSHAIENDSFKRFVKVVGQFGPGYKPPTQYQLREPLLKKEVERTKGLLKRQEEEWAKNGCSIITDAWSDRKRRSIMNLCVNCAEETTFLSSKEASDESHTGKYMFEYVDKCIEEIGPHNVVQVVTDNVSNNMAAGDLSKLKRPTIFWTSCATHTINLMLQGISTQPKFKNVIDKSQRVSPSTFMHITRLCT